MLKKNVLWKGVIIFLVYILFAIFLLFATSRFERLDRSYNKAIEVRR